MYHRVILFTLAYIKYHIKILNKIQKTLWKTLSGKTFCRETPFFLCVCECACVSFNKRPVDFDVSNIGGGFLQVTYSSINNLLPFKCFQSHCTIMMIRCEYGGWAKRVWVVYLIMFHEKGFCMKLESERFCKSRYYNTWTSVVYWFFKIIPFQKVSKCQGYSIISLRFLFD